MSRKRKVEVSAGEPADISRLQRKWPALNVELWPIDKVRPRKSNPVEHPEEQIASLAHSMKENGWTFACLVDPKGELIAGEGRWLAAKFLGWEEAAVIVARDWSADQIRAYVIADNALAEGKRWNPEKLKLELDSLKAINFDIGNLGFDPDRLAELMNPGGSATGQSNAGSLAERFGVPPFTIFNASKGWWQDRKEAWISLGIKSELGRGDNLSAMAGAIDRREAIKKKGRQPNAEPGGSKLPAANYGKTRARGDGKGRAVG